MLSTLHRTRQLERELAGAGREGPLRR
jgi:hypothetical protein